MDYIIREILPQEYNLLYNFLYEAIFIPEGMERNIYGFWNAGFN